MAAITFEHISKRFGSVNANSDVSFSEEKGEILALLGENGSGKTTLMNMLSGIYYPDEGRILVDDKPVSIRGPRDAYALGIGMVHQHFKLVDVFTAAENLVVGLDPDKKLDRKAIAADIKEICDKYQFDVNPDKKVYDMSVSEKQTLEIVKVLYRGANILILDEPTAVLTPQETERLFTVLRNMKQDGKTVIIITHKLHEVLSISDRVAILRKGEYIETVETADATEEKLTELMVGKKVDLEIERPEIEDKKPRLEVRNINCINSEGVRVLKDISFVAEPGETVAIIGETGCGKTSLIQMIPRFFEATEGQVLVDNVPVENYKIEDLRKNIGLATQDVLLYSDTIEGNIAYGASTMKPDEVTKYAKYSAAADFIEKLPEGYDTIVGERGVGLSGGQKQRISLARALAIKPSILILDDTTSAVDMETEKVIQHSLRNLDFECTKIIIAQRISTTKAADKILVLKDGKIIEEGSHQELVEKKGYYADLVNLQIGEMAV